MDSLRHRTIRALFWSFAEAGGVRSVQFIIGIVLARLLLPEQYGLIGMLTIFMAVSQSFLDSGFGAALIQKRDATHVDTCSIFYFNIAVGLIAAGLLCLAAPWIAAFSSMEASYSSPRRSIAAYTDRYPTVGALLSMALKCFCGILRFSKDILEQRRSANGDGIATQFFTHASRSERFNDDLLGVRVP